MDLRQLGYVVAVVDHGGFSRAAAAVHVAQPSLSQAIRSLESELGVALFDRVGRRVVLTAAGHALVEPARQVLRGATSIRAAVDAVRGVVAGHLDLVALPTLAVDPTAPLIGAFRRRHPGVTVRLAEPEDDHDLVVAVRSGEAELALAELPVPGDFVVEPIEDQRFVAVMPPGGPPRSRINVEDLAGLPFVTTPRGTSTRRLLDTALGAAGVEVTVAVETGQREAILPLVLAGAGVALVPRALAETARARGAAVVSVRPAISRQIGLVHRPSPLSPAAAAFVAVVHDWRAGRDVSAAGPA